MSIGTRLQHSSTLNWSQRGDIAKYGERALVEAGLDTVVLSTFKAINRSTSLSVCYLLIESVCVCVREREKLILIDKVYYVFDVLSDRMFRK